MHAPSRLFISLAFKVPSNTKDTPKSSETGRRTKRNPTFFFQRTPRSSNQPQTFPSHLLPPFQKKHQTPLVQQHETTKPKHQAAPERHCCQVAGCWPPAGFSASAQRTTWLRSHVPRWKTFARVVRKAPGAAKMLSEEMMRKCAVLFG